MHEPLIKAVTGQTVGASTMVTAYTVPPAVVRASAANSVTSVHRHGVPVSCSSSRTAHVAAATTLGASASETGANVGATDGASVTGASVVVSPVAAMVAGATNVSKTTAPPAVAGSEGSTSAHVASSRVAKNTRYRAKNAPASGCWRRG